MSAIVCVPRRQIRLKTKISTNVNPFVQNQDLSLTEISLLARNKINWCEKFYSIRLNAQVKRKQKKPTRKKDRERERQSRMSTTAERYKHSKYRAQHQRKVIMATH